MHKKRKDFLQEMLIGIYKTDRLNFDGKEASIIGRSIFSKCDLSNDKSRGHSYECFRQLLNVTFWDSDTTWSIDTEGKGYNMAKAARKEIKQTQFSTITAVDNSFAYLESIGVKFSPFFKTNPREIEGIREILYGILLELLNLVFFLEISGKEITDKDDISSLVENKISSVNFSLIRKAYEVSGSVSATPDNSIVESGKDKKGCNRFIYVRSNDLNIHNLVSIQAPSINSVIIKKKEGMNAPSKIDSCGYDWLMKDLGAYYPEDNKVFHLVSPPPSSESIYDIISSSEQNFISDIHPDPSSIKEFGIYYLFAIDENKIKALYPDVLTPYALRTAIICRAYSDLIIPFKNRIAKYLHNVLMYIEDVVARVSSIDHRNLITGVLDSETVSAFNVDYDKMQLFYKNNNVTEEANLYLYMMIDRALQEFCRQLRFDTVNLISSLLEYVDHNRIKEHLEKLHSFVTSETIKKAIEIQSEDERKNKSDYRSSNSVSEEKYVVEAYKKKTPGLFREFFDSVNTYYLLLGKKMKE